MKPNMHRILPIKTSTNTFFQRRNRNEELSSMLSFEISHMPSTTSVEEVICLLKHLFSDNWSLHGRVVRLFNGTLRPNFI